MNLFELFVKIGVDDQASDKISNLSSKLGDGLKTSAKIGAAAVGAAAAGITALTTAAVNNYAEYEQLVGGVETLFKTSSDKVMGYAENAYKTAGLSANEYMETVTSFSASLLQSLGGDTEEAAKYADMAITDMSDNANKMGTSMEMIQNAYRGFSRANYTMLDNLALGYGGTKEEMQRLIADAAELSDTVDAQSMSFSNIVEAIHVVQTEMGITGTTAKEAGTTIQGAVSSMKSAWTNLLTGLSDGNANLKQLVDNLVTTIVGDGTESNLGVFGNILPAVETALNGASTLISKALPEIIEIIPSIINDNFPILAKAAISIIQNLIDGISQNQEMFFETIFDVVTYLVESFVTMLPQIVQLGLDLIISLANGIAESLPELIPTIIDVVLQIVDTLTDPETLSQLLDAALTLILALAEGLLSEDSINGIIDSVFLLIDNIVTFLTDPENIMKLMDAAVRLVIAIAEGLISAVGRIQEKAGELIDKFKTKFEETDWIQLGKDIINSVKDGIVSIAEKAGTWGKDLIDNFIGGIKEKWENLKKTVSNVAQSVKDFLGFSEPKKGPLSNFHTYAPDMMDLFAKGIRDNEDVITEQIEKSFNFGERTMKFGAEYENAYGVAKYDGMAYGGSTIGTVNININGANVQNDSALADMIAERLQIMTERRGAAFA